MNAPIHNFPKTARPQIGGQMLAMRWAALEDAGAVAAMLAQVDDSEAKQPVQAMLGALTGWHGEQVERQMANLSVVMEAGLSAILSVREDGSDTKVAADALWREFAEARTAIKALLKGA